MVPSPSDLTYFVEVTKTLNFSRAAERIGISQPSLTMAIRRLEDNIGTTLFIRHKKGVELTRQGHGLLQRASQLLKSWEELKAQVVQSIDELEGVLTLGCHPSVALYSLSHFLPEVMKKYPQLLIQLRHDLSRRIAEDVISFRVDLGIVVNPVKHPDLIVHRLCYDQVTLWKSKKLKDSSGGNWDERVLICDPELIQSQEILKKLNRRQIQFKRILSTSSLEVVADLTAHGGGIGLLPSRVALQNPSFQLEKIKESPHFSDEICLVYRVENKNIKAFQVLVEAIRKVFKE